MVGWYGVLAILGAYTLVSFGVLNPLNLWYQLLNLTGAFAIIVHSFSKKDYQPGVLNIIWMIIAIIAIGQIIF